MNNPKQMILEVKCKECGKKLVLSLPVYMTEQEMEKNQSRMG